MPIRHSEIGKFQTDDPDHPLIVIAERYTKRIYQTLVRHGYKDEFQLSSDYLNLIRFQLHRHNVAEAHKALGDYIKWLKHTEKLYEKKLNLPHVEPTRNVTHDLIILD